MKFYIRYYAVTPHQEFSVVTDSFKDDPTYMAFLEASARGIRLSRYPDFVFLNNSCHCEIEADSVRQAIEKFWEKVENGKVEDV